MMSRDSLTTRDRDGVERELDGERRSYWDRTARRLAVEINAGWWLSGWLPWAAGILAAGTFGLLYARWQGSGGWMPAAIGLALAGAAVVTWWRCRSRFETLASARVRLEDALGLDARLTAAGAGVGTWPAPPPADERRWPITWRWGKPVAVLTILGCLLAIAAWIPLEVPGESRPHVIEKPTDARVVEQWLEAVEREHAVDDKGIEDKKQAIAEILARPTEQWYEHASLEAAGALKERTEAALRELAENLATAERAAENLAEMAAALPLDLRDRLLDELKAAAEGLAQGDFRPPANLAEMLRQMEPSMSPGASGRCDPAEMRRLAETLAANRDALERALAAAPGLDREALERALAGGAPAARPGRGGVDRGRSDADLSLGEERDLGTTRKERVDLTMDPARAAPQDLLAVLDGEHEIDETAYNGPQAGGTVAHEGDGGMAAQVDSLLPAERAAVRRYFE